MPSVPSRRARLLVALVIGVLSAAFVVVSTRGAQASGWPGTDWDQAWGGARAMLAGRDPYREVGPGRPFEWPWPLYYPVTALVAVLPLTVLPLAVARALFVGLSAACLAMAVTRDGWTRLPLFLGGSYFLAAWSGQWSPIMTAAWVYPGLGWLAAAKPNVGMALLLAARTRRHAAIIVVGGVALGIASLVFYPTWPAVWIATVRSAAHFRAPVTLLGGPLILLALLRWRRPESRLIVALACVPQTTYVYEALPLALVAATRMESIVLAFGSVFALVGQVWLANNRTDAFELHALLTGRLIVACCYLPCVAMVLRRPNVGLSDALIRRAETTESVRARSAGISST